ncbi:MAG: DUF3891 family protein [Caldilineaceae bacterium]
MIVRDMPNGQVLCLHQTTHALNGRTICAPLGQCRFCQTDPYAETMLAVAQHDNGWYEWECAPASAPMVTPWIFSKTTTRWPRSTSGGSASTAPTPNIPTPPSSSAVMRRGSIKARCCRRSR